MINQAISFIPIEYLSENNNSYQKEIEKMTNIWESACGCNNLRRIVIASPDERITDICFELGAEFLITPTQKNKYDIFHYSYKALLEESDIILNLNYSTIIASSQKIDYLLEIFSNKTADSAFLIKCISEDELLDSNIHKVFINHENYIVSFFDNPNEINNFYETDLKIMKIIDIFAYKRKVFSIIENLTNNQESNNIYYYHKHLLQNGFKYIGFLID